MEILSVFDKAFAPYGAVLEGYDFTELLQVLDTTPTPMGGSTYRPSHEGMEATAVAAQIQKRYYGDMPVQIGYCCGQNKKLNCLEYHRDDEVDICSTDMILMLALQSELENYTLDTSKVKAFLVPAGTGVMLRSAALHYCPCHVGGDDRFFRMAVVLPKNTNTSMPRPEPQCAEDKLLWARNKWLIAHPDSSEAGKGAFVGLIGENLSV